MIRIGIAGASGYTGIELVRLLTHHPKAEVVRLFAHSHSGELVGSVYPHLTHRFHQWRYESLSPAAIDDLDVLFLALPHGQSQHLYEWLSTTHLKIIDLSADFRLRTTQDYQRGYGVPHHRPDVLGHIPLGLPELYRDQIRGASYVACPGCYATSVMLGLYPLASAGLLPDGVVIDAKSGVSGAGRGPKESLMYCEVNEGFSAYGTYTHRHVPEMEMVLGKRVFFSPHLVPMNRGILSSMYVPIPQGDAIEALYDRYRDEPFVCVNPGGNPSTATVTGSNMAMIWLHWVEGCQQLVVFGAIDNVIKGASGQGIQCMNVMLGLPETMGLPMVAHYY